MTKKKVTLIAAMILALAVALPVSYALTQNDVAPTPEATAAADLPAADYRLEETQEIDFSALAVYGQPVIVDYGSDSCIPCKAMAPVLKQMNEEFAGKAFVKFVDVWKYADAADNVPVQLIPTQVLFNADGTPFDPSEELMASVGDFVMYSDRTSGEHVFTVHQGGLTEPQMRAILAEMGVSSDD